MTEAKNPEEHPSAPGADGPADAAMADPKTDVKTGATATAATGPRCRSCGTPLVADQRWCLECGAARTPNRWHSGRRSLALTAALTIGLLGVAVAASYAAIVDESPISPTATVAAVPPPVVTPSPTTSTAATTPDYVPPTGSSASTGTSAVDGLSSVDSSSYGTDTGSTGSDTSAGSDTVVTPDPATTKTTTTTPKPPAPTAIRIKASALSTYDPSGNQQAPNGGDPAGALAASRSNAFTVLTAADQPTMDVGLAVDLGKGKGIGSIRFKTSTPGYKVEIYGSFQDTPPPTIDDSRWAFIKSRRNVGSGREVIDLSDDTTKYKQLLLWLTTPPKAGVPANLYALKLYN